MAQHWEFKRKKLCFEEKRKKSAQILFDAMIGKMTMIDNEPLSPLMITSCNGAASWPFSDASVDYKYPNPTDWYQFEVWFRQFYIDLGEKMKGNKEVTKEETKILECLMDVFIDIGGHHLLCLQRLLIEELTEAKLTALLALHYFKPLAYGSSYVIDDKSSHYSKCELCKEDVICGDTSFGSKKVWHGRANIVLQRSVVNVCLEKDLKEKEEVEANLACRDEPEEYKIYEHFNCLSITEVKTERKMNLMKKKSRCQAISQGITNAFCQAQKDEDLFNKFIPAFLVTEKYITIIMYNCELDKLLMSGKYPIWEETGKILDLSTVLKVWFTLNYCYKLDETSEYICLSGCTPAAGFKNAMGEAYESYLKDVQMPLNKDEEVGDLYLDSLKSDVGQQLRARAVIDVSEMFYNLNMN